MSQQELRQALCECFDLIDVDKSGHLDVKELFSVVTEFNQSSHCHKSMSDEEIKASVQEFIQVADKNSDNKISKSEFLEFFINVYQ